MKTIEFKEAIAEAAGTTKNLLLGNGFSIALEKSQFSYKSLFEAAKFGSPLKDIFKDLKTQDFEKVMKALSDAERILRLYDQEEQTTQLLEGIKNDAKKLKESLISAIQKNHPAHQSCLESKSCFCRKFLAHFIPKWGNSGRIFTLNYDLLLYWVLMRDEDCNEPKLYFDDGFRRDSLLRWNPFHEQTIYYLHGALHLYDEDTEIRKLHLKDPSPLLLEQIETKINKEDFPMFVSEGNSSKKLEKIQHNPYLDHAFNAFTQVMNCQYQSLFIFGCSFNETDSHIFDAIKKGKIEKVFVSVYEDPKKQKQEQEKETSDFCEQVTKRLKREKLPGRKITFFTANSTQVWGK